MLVDSFQKTIIWSFVHYQVEFYKFGTFPLASSILTAAPKCWEKPWLWPWTDQEIYFGLPMIGDILSRLKLMVPQENFRLVFDHMVNDIKKYFSRKHSFGTLTHFLGKNFVKITVCFTKFDLTKFSFFIMNEMKNLLSTKFFPSNQLISD